MTETPNPSNSSETSSHSRLIEPGSPEEALARLDKIRDAMAERFHMYQEIQALPSADRDALFRLLWDAQAGDTEALEAIYSLCYDEQPVDMEEFVLGSRYLALKGQINQEKLELLIAADHPGCRKFFCAAGSGSGKSFIVSIAKAREVYKLLCLKRPDLFYMLGPGSKIAVINLSVSKEQAKDVIFAEFTARIKGSPWFEKKFEAQTSKCKFPKNVYVMSGGSGAISYFGYHTKFGSLDEASFLVDRSDRSVAEELCEAMLKSLETRFPRAYKLFVISTLRSTDDFLAANVERLKTEGVPVKVTPLVV